MYNVKKHLEILGYEVIDKVTKFKGVAASVSHDLYGCVQVLVNPGITDGKLGDQIWFDISRLEKVSSTRVMEPPDWFEDNLQSQGKQGAELKPVFKN